MSDYPPDPGGAFASDAHRRVMAHLPNPDDDPLSVQALITDRINRDPHTLAHFADANELVTVLGELKDEGHAKELKDGWKNTPDGFELLTGPPNDVFTDRAVPSVFTLDPATVSN